MSLATGDRLGGYQILAPIGAGGMGEVYRAADTKLGREVAIKALTADVTGNPERLARFRREAKLLASLNHQHIAAIYGLEEVDGTPYLVLELVEGEDLSERLKRGAIPLADSLAIAGQIAQGLESAHEKGIVHRDLKPANVKLKADGSVKVLDFGLAKAYTGDGEGSEPDLSHSPTLARSGTEAGLILGTAAYMSPEQARGRPVDKRADIWAFGVLLFEMLTGLRLFRGETVSDTLAAVLKTDPDWSLLPSETPAAIRRLLLRCLDKDPKRRLRDIGDARIELDSPGPNDSSPLHRASLAKPVLLLAGAAALVGGLATAWALLGPHQAKPPSQIVRLQLLPPDKLSFRNIAISPDGRLLAFTAANAAGQTGLWVRPLDSLTASLLPDTTGASYPFWSPDGRSIGFFTGEKLKRVDPSGASQQTVCNLLNARGGARGGTWSRDGVILFGVEAFHPAPLYQVAAGGGQPREVKTLDLVGQDVHRYSPVFLPDGRHFLYLAAGARESTGIRLGSLDSDATRVVARTDTPAAYLEPRDGGLTAHGLVLFVRDRALMAQPFDQQRREVVGDPLLALSYVPEVSVSTNGTVVHRSGAGGSPIYESGAFGQTQLQWLDRAGTLVSLLGEAGLLVDVRISPDGSRVAAQRGDGVGSSDLWLFDLPRATLSRFTFGTAYHGAPVWSPDGARIAFFSYRDGPWALYEKTLSRDAGDRPLLESKSDLVPNDWSPNGESLIYSELEASGKSHLRLLAFPPPVEGPQVAIPITGSPSDENFARFSPDGRFIVYQSDESGSVEIYVRAFDPSGAAAGGKWQISTNGGIEPRWPRRGREIFYIGPDNMLMAVTVQTGTTFEAGAPRALFPVLPAGVLRYDVTPDGQRFLVAKSTEEVGTPATVVLGLFDQPLRQAATQ